MNPNSILLVDDEQDIVSIFARALESAGHKVYSFTDPLEALEYFKENPDRFALVISDIRMPNMDGLEFSKEIRTIKPKVKLLLMTAFELSDYESTGVVPSLEVDEFLSKPMSTKQLKAVVSKHLSSFGAALVV